MRDEEFDLIAALAAGDLDPVEVAEAEALVARGGVYREEYEAQLAAIEALAGAGPARMTDLERARLQRAVLAEVGAPQVKPVAPRSLRWLRPVAAAAAAVVVVGFGGLMLANLGGGDSAADFATLENEAALSQATSTTNAASESAPVAGSDVEDAAAIPADAEGFQRAIGAEPLELGPVSSRDIDDQYLTQIYLGAAQYTSDAPGNLAQTGLSCAPTAGELAEEDLLAYGTATYDGTAAQYFGFVSRRLIFLDVRDCSVLGEHP